MGTKVFIAILVGLVVLFVVGVAAPAVTGGDQPASPRGGLGDTLRGLVEQPLDLQADAQASPASCVQGRTIVMPAGSLCTLTIKAAEGFFVPTRKLEMRLEQGTAKVQVDQDGGVNISHDLDPGDPEMTVNIFKEGATVTIACIGGLQACQLALPLPEQA